MPYDSRRLPKLAAAAVLAAAFPALALNHTVVSAPMAVQGPYKVGCSNIAQDASKIIAGASASDYWEGRTVNEQPLYIDQILAAPDTTLKFETIVPNASEYPNLSNQRVPFVAIVCYPTNSWNNDPDYLLPGTSDFVPRMQRPGTMPNLITISEYARSPGTFGEEPAAKVPLIVYSHGLGGSPIGNGYLQSIALLASQGYMVAAVFHADSRFSRIRVEDLSDYFYLVTQYDRVAEMELMRPLALKTMVDVLLAHPYFKQGIDPERIGGFGASLGGEAMANLLGAKLTTNILTLSCKETARDPRIKVAVGFVPYAGQTFLPAFCEDQAGADEVTRPFLALSGTADLTAPVHMMRKAVNRFKGSRYLVELVDGQHELRPEDIGDLFTWMVTFYRAYLQDDAAAFASFSRLYGVVGGREDKLTIDAHVPQTLASGEVRVTELHNDRIDRFFLEPDPLQVDAILKGSAGDGWALTGHSFKAFSQPPASGQASCHYDHDIRVGATVYAECGWTKRLGRWTYDEAGDFFIESPDRFGSCRAGLLEVNRLYHPRFALNRATSNQRFVTSDSEARAMMDDGWILVPTTMCARH